MSLPDASTEIPYTSVHAVVASALVGDCDPEVMTLALCERRDARAKFDNGVTPPTEPLWGLDDTERRCGCDATYTCRAHEAGTRPDFTCECVLGADETRRLYRVTGHGGEVSTCSYCQDCADLAAMDWNGETAAIEAVTDGGVTGTSVIDATRRFVTSDDDELITLVDLANLNGWAHDDPRVLTLSRLGLNDSADIGTFVATRVD